jgi:hypothetical protein
MEYENKKKGVLNKKIFPIISKAPPFVIFNYFAIGLSSAGRSPTTY